MMMRKHIRMYNSEYFPKLGGIITHMQDVSRILHGRGLYVDIVCDQCKEDIDAEVPVYSIPTYEPKTIYQKLYRPKCEVEHLVRHLPDAMGVDLHWPREPHYARALLEKYGADKLLYIMPTVRPKMFDFSECWGIKNRLRSLVFRSQIARIEGEVVKQCQVAVDSQARKDEVVAYYRADPDRVHVVPLAIDEKRYVIECSEHRPDSPTIGLTVARLSPEKGVDSLLESLAQLKNKDWNWVIVGDGWMRSYLESMRDRLGLGEQVKFVGSVDAKPYYAKADVFVLPSSYEGFGLVLLEAMVNKLPCIAFDSCPPDVITASKEIINHQHTGLLAKAGSSQSLAACITKLLDDKALRLKMGEQGYQRSITAFSWEKCVQGYLSITGNSLKGGTRFG